MNGSVSPGLRIQEVDMHVEPASFSDRWIFTHRLLHDVAVFLDERLERGLHHACSAAERRDFGADYFDGEGDVVRGMLLQGMLQDVACLVIGRVSFQCKLFVSLFC